MRYRAASLWDKPWGEVRYSWTSTPSTTPAYKLSDYTFTGQFSYMDDPSTSSVTEGFGLMFYRAASLWDNARWYDPALGRFAQADTITPGGVQGLDRYAYVNNSPLNYVDPTGHFTEDAIDKYLAGYCGGLKRQMDDCAGTMKDIWQADEDWWDMITTAEAGDNLFGTYDNQGGQFTVTFTGSSNTTLTGINSTDLPSPMNSMNLTDVQKGVKYGPHVFGGRFSTNKVTLNWMGFYRTDERGKPSFYVRPGYDLKQYKTDPFWSEGMDIVAGAYVAAVANEIYPVTTIVGSFLAGGAVGALTPSVSDALNAQPYDVNVHIGPVYFNFQLTSDDTWKLEGSP